MLLESVWAQLASLQHWYLPKEKLDLQSLNTVGLVLVEQFQ